MNYYAYVLFFAAFFAGIRSGLYSKTSELSTIRWTLGAEIPALVAKWLGSPIGENSK